MTTADHSLALVGAGGNIGSQLVPHLARLPGLRRLLLVDPGAYEPGDLAGQAMLPDDAGKPKAHVQATVARAINPKLQVTALRKRIEEVPPGLLRCEAILTGLDSRRARMTVNQLAWRLGVPWIDGGVDGARLLARICAYVPGPESPCLECAWDRRDYEAVEQVYPCREEEQEAPATAAPSALGALAASLEVLEMQKLLAGDGPLAAGRQVLLDALHHRHLVAELPRNPRCRFDHQVWRVRPLRRRPADVTIGELLKLGSDGRRNGAVLEVGGRAFVRTLTCPLCGAKKRLLRLQGRLLPGHRTCPECEGRMRPAGFEMTDGLSRHGLTHRTRELTLEKLGLLAGDIVTLRAARGTRHYELRPATEGGGDR